MSKYPKNIALIKLNTLEDAEYPQKEKYPDNSVHTGLMWEFGLPKVGRLFYVHTEKLHITFSTSVVQEIIEQTDTYILFRTSNSTYKIEMT